MILNGYLIIRMGQYFKGLTIKTDRLKVTGYTIMKMVRLKNHLIIDTVFMGKRNRRGRLKTSYFL